MAKSCNAESWDSAVGKCWREIKQREERHSVGASRLLAVPWTKSLAHSTA